ncbi:MAG: sulfatase-like hydrolase/transferase, partial [Bdellovibrionales bacterium]|nr:sulfatase-like hydrolase/transferase [Bdellovibrionales bacterium]
MISLFVTSCSPFMTKKPPIILILVEALSEQNYLCSKPEDVEDLEDLQQVCQGFLRFTHAFAPSTMNQPVISSLHTGLPVNEHGVTHNGAQGLSGKFNTLSEQALSQGMRTAFFSGGVPLMEKFGLSQGYEIYEDSYSAKNKSHFRPFEKSIEKAMKWIDEEVKNKSFFTTFYVPDLLYPEKMTVSDSNNERPRTKKAQIEEFYENLNKLVSELKKRSRWDNSHVIVVGLSGESPIYHRNQPLSSAKLKVPLQMKLAKTVSSNLKKYESHLLSFHRLGQWLQQLIFH